MKYIIPKILILITFLSCKNTKQENADNCARFEGKVYSAILPCASCSGIAMRISLDVNGEFTKEVTYLGESSFPEINTGSYKIVDSIIYLEYPVKINNDFFKMKPDNKISFLNKDRREIEGKLADLYMFSSIPLLKPIEVSGTYHNSSGNRIVVAYKGDNKYKVEVYSKIKSGGLLFKAFGIANNDRLTICMKQLHQEMLSKMTMTFDGDNLFLYINNPSLLYEWEYMCDGKISLIGNYKKNKNAGKRKNSFRDGS